jgi:hypothetical protein
MFQVKRKDNYEVVRNVYATKETELGELMLLTFSVTSWVWIPADEYVPIDFI